MTKIEVHETDTWDNNHQQHMITSYEHLYGALLITTQIDKHYSWLPYLNNGCNVKENTTHFLPDNIEAYSKKQECPRIITSTQQWPERRLFIDTWRINKFHIFLTTTPMILF